MGLKSDNWIRKMSDKYGMIDPFEGGSVRHTQQGPIVSYGTSSFGYDIRCAPEFKICTNAFSSVIDPKDFNDQSFIEHKANECIVPPHGFVLARSVEYIRMPPNVLAWCIGKTTYSRCGVLINVTPLEPSWEGHVTLKISNTMPLPAKIYANEGIAQIIFFEGDDRPSTTYAEKRGRYQGQRGITGPKV